MEEELEANNQDIFLEKRDDLEAIYIQPNLDKLEKKVKIIESKLEGQNKEDDRNKKDTQVVLK